MNDIKLRKLQIVLIQGLNEIDRICRKNNIPYYMIAGTLLGSVRHKGFIPWDSDIDVAMFRDDYERFIEICSEDLSSDFTLQNPKVDVNCQVPFTRIRINDTQFVSKQNVGRNKQESLYVDVFPLDPAPMNIGCSVLLKEKYIKLLCRLLSYRNGDISTKTVIRRIVMDILTILSKPITNESITNKLEKVMRLSGDKSTIFVTNYASSYGIKRERQLKTDFDDPIELEFEGSKYFAPRNYKEVLNNVYGDYMILPPINERKSVDLKEYIVDINSYISKHRFLEDVEKLE